MNPLSPGEPAERSHTDQAWRSGPPPPELSPGPVQASEQPHVPSQRWGFGAFLLVEVVFVLSSVLVVLPFKPGGSGQIPPLGLLVSLAVPTLLAAGVAVLATVLRGNGPVLDLRLRWSRHDVGVGLLLGLGGLVVTMAASSVWARWVGPQHANSAVGSLLDGVRFPPALAVLMFLQVWLVAPLCEEIIYRGLLWGAIERLRWGRMTALVLTTVIFAIAHLEPLRTPLLLVIAVPIGMGRFLTGRLPASVIAHQVNNLLPALGILLMALGVLSS